MVKLRTKTHKHPKDPIRRPKIIDKSQRVSDRRQLIAQILEAFRSGGVSLIVEKIENQGKAKERL